MAAKKPKKYVLKPGSFFLKDANCTSITMGQYKAEQEKNTSTRGAVPRKGGRPIPNAPGTSAC